MKKNDKRGSIIRETMLLIGILAAITLICRLWPLLLFMLLSLFTALIVLLFRATDQPEIIEPKPVSEASERPARTPTQNDVYELAYSVILGRVTQMVHQRYPQARWIWESSNIRQLIENGEDVFILLNRAGGYRRAKIMITNLQVKDIVFVGVNPSETDEKPDIFEPDDDVPENYELLAFEWVETHIIDINNRCNEAIGEGESGVLIPADELPVKESWLDVCRQLKKVEIENPECVPEGIQINLTH